MTREEAIYILSTRDAHGVLCGYTSGVTEALDMAIEALQDRPNGEWYQIKDHKIMGEGYLWHCSICDYKVYQDSSKDYPTENYCPNCGADMRGERGE